MGRVDSRPRSAWRRRCRTVGAWCLDRMSLRPTRTPIRRDELQRHRLELGQGTIELFSWDAINGGALSADAGLNGASFPAWEVIKFVGSGGRAERVTSHPLDLLSEQPGRIWIAHPPGYGGSPGPARLEDFYPAARAVYDYVASRAAPQSPLVLMGGSLGATVALRLAAEVDCAGLILRDIATIRSVILRRYRGLGPAAHWFARLVPPSLNAARAAARCRAPALIVVSRLDRIVPSDCQQRVVRAYAGPHRVVRVASDHLGPLPPDDAQDYRDGLQWLVSHIRSAPTGDICPPD